MSQLFKGFAVLIMGWSMITPAHAGKWSNQFVEFELPSDWACLLEGTEWVCQNGIDAAKKKEAIIILAAKLQGNQDTLDQYLNYLKTPKVYTNSQGKQITSQVKTAQNRTILEQPWVDSLHVDSEIAGFYTRYLATVKEGLGILVTYSVNKNKYTDYSPMFESMVKTLKVFRREGGLNALRPRRTFSAMRRSPPPFRTTPFSRWPARTTRSRKQSKRRDFHLKSWPPIPSPSGVSVQWS